MTFRHPGGTTSTGRIDCYKRECFIWEAKQSAKRKKARETEQLELAGMEATQKLGDVRRGTKSWDMVLIAAMKTKCFDPFPFPILTEQQSAKLDTLGERLDAFRK